MDNTKVKVLAVDDDRSMLMMLQTQIEDLEYKVATACDGQEAWIYIQENYQDIDVVVIDREMPNMDGLQVVSLMKKDDRYKNIPVIMQTGYDSSDQIKEGIDAGVYYYLTKPIDESVLASVLLAAVREAKQQKTLNSELQQHKSSFGLINNCNFKVTTLNEAEDLASFIANCFPDPGRVVSGLASLLVNAIEHGSLGVGYEAKTDLIARGVWRSEIERLQRLPENSGKVVDVQFKRSKDSCLVKIVDLGDGFAWQQFLKIDPARAQNNHGRGIAQALAISFDRIVYKGSGSEVIACVNNEPDIEW